MDARQIFDHFYPVEGPLRQLLLHHSLQVAERAVRVWREHPDLGADRALLERGALLHDIGICQCDAPRIHCFGTSHYIMHGLLGAQMLRNIGSEWEAEARICERHTGTGLRREAFQMRHLDVPPCDLLPETLEEQIVCYADKFFSKTGSQEEKTLEQALRSVEKFGEEQAAILLQWHERFG